jgi:heme exporter protein D
VNLGPHAAFILTAYAAAIVIVATLVGWVLVDYRVQRRLLTDLDRSGVVRRSERMGRDAANAPAESA